MTNLSKSELLLPVGNMNMCLAAIHNGADAIYVGMPQFNARGRTTDFQTSELKEMIDLCHLYGVRVNVAFNIVIFENEYLEVIPLLKEVLALGPDALIVQDVGLCTLIRKIAPEQVIHGSTQMTVTNHEAISFLEDLKIKRFVLGRECSLSEIRAIKEKTNKELEVFVHGALCVAYSGQCFTSESIGGRSANRGQCAQSCRFEYEMIVDGKKKILGDFKYLVSPQDLCGIAEIPELLDIGVESFKVEGRLKTPEYVAAAASEYRHVIDQTLKGKSVSEKEILEAKTEMSLTYSRGFFSGWLHGVNHQDLVDGTYGAHRGLEIGKVLRVEPRGVVVESQYEKLKNGDGVLFAGYVNDKKTEIGGLIYGIKPLKNNQYLLEFDKKFEFQKVKKDFLFYLNHDQAVTKKLSNSYQDKNQKKRISIDLEVEATIGKPLRVVATDGQNSVEVSSSSLVEAASARPVGKKDLIDELGALGSTCFKLGRMTLKSQEDFFIHQKELKIIRRDFSEKLHLMRVNPRDIQIHDLSVADFFTKANTKESINPKLTLLLREIGQVEDLVNFKDLSKEDIEIVYLDYEFGKGYAESVELLRKTGFKVGIATTRILKPNEYYNFKILKRANPDVILCRNLGALNYFGNVDTDHQFELRGDFSLNITNSLSANYFFNKGVKTLSASYDLNSKQLLDMLEHTDGSRIEVTTHQYMPSFHMEHCVFAAFLSEGKSFRDCGKPCEDHRVELKDQFGHYHQIKADQECRNTMFNAIPQSAAKMIPQLKEKGVSLFRFEALYERGSELKNKISGYIKILKMNSLEEMNVMIDRIGVSEKYGLSDGAHREKEHENRKK